MAPARLLLYALGGGLGHVSRATAVGRAAATRGYAVTLVTNSRLAGALAIEPLLGPRARVVRLDPALGRAGVAAAVARLVAAPVWDLLVVDTFPRGLAGELPALLDADARPRVLIHRALRAEYVARLDLDAVAARYSRLVVPGEPAPLAHHPHAVTTAPILLLEPADLLDRGAARRALGVATGDPRRVVLVSGCGTALEIADAAALAAFLEARLDTALVRLAVPPGAPAESACSSTRPWPLGPLLPGVDVLVGAGGYHTVHEARATGTPLVAFARRRLYDDQAARLRPAERVATREEALARTRALLAAPATAPAASVASGAAATMDAIEGCLERAA